MQNIKISKANGNGWKLSVTANLEGDWVEVGHIQVDFGRSPRSPYYGPENTIHHYRFWANAGHPQLDEMIIEENVIDYNNNRTQTPAQAKKALKQQIASILYA